MSPGRSLMLPAERRPTYYYLQHAKQFSPVYLSTDVDMTKVRAHKRLQFEETGKRFSYISYVIRSASLALCQHPSANASVSHGRFPRYLRNSEIHAKFTVDKRASGARFVVPGVVLDSDRADLSEIQARVDYIRDGAFESLDEFKSARFLRKVPLGIGQWLYNLALSNLKRRGRLQGTFAVTSLGHRPVRDFFPVISSSLCFGMGAIEPRPVVVDGEIVVRDTMTLSFVFDHAVIDGGLAADLLSDVRTCLESGSWETRTTRSEGERPTRLLPASLGLERCGDRA